MACRGVVGGICVGSIRWRVRVGGECRGVSGEGCSLILTNKNGCLLIFLESFRVKDGWV